MSDEMLSQEEIDALLNGGDSNDDHKVEVNDHLSVIEQDAIGEIGNISFGSAATALSTLLNQKVEITTPAISIVERRNLSEEFPQPHVAVLVKYTEGFKGSNVLVIKTTDAQIIADIMLGGDGRNPTGDFGDLHISAVQEAMNQMMGSASTSMSTVFDKKVDISPPSIDLLYVEEGQGTNTIPDEEILVKVSFRIKIGDLIDSNIMQLVPVDFAKELVEELLNPQEKEDKPMMDISHHRNEENRSKSSKFEKASDSYNSEDQAVLSQADSRRSANVQPAAFSDFNERAYKQPESKNLNMMLDIPLGVTVELGRTKRTVKDILDLSPGSIIELDKLAGEPVDILVNQKLIAKGEVVVIDENFGVRVTEIISQTDRLRNL
jgi:flagellar motor switch protein FliN/FliY